MYVSVLQRDLNPLESINYTSYRQLRKKHDIGDRDQNFYFSIHGLGGSAGYNSEIER